MKSQYNKTITACFVGYIVQAIVNNFTPLLFLFFPSSSPDVAAFWIKQRSSAGSPPAKFLPSVSRSFVFSIPEKEKNSRRKRMPAISRHTPFICFCFIVISQSLSELCCKNRRFSYL